MAEWGEAVAKLPSRSRWGAWRRASGFSGTGRAGSRPSEHLPDEERARVKSWSYSRVPLLMTEVLIGAYGVPGVRLS